MHLPIRGLSTGMVILGIRSIKIIGKKKSYCSFNINVPAMSDKRLELYYSF